jgi:hypothetical protein
MQSDAETAFFAALPIKLADSLVEMCRIWGIKPHNIESLTVFEYLLIKKHAAESAGIFLPQENGLRLLLTDGGKLSHVYFINDEPAHLTVALDRVIDLPHRRVYIYGNPHLALERYFNERMITLCQL